MFVRCEAPSLIFQRTLFLKGEVREISEDLVQYMTRVIASGDVSLHEKDPSAPTKPKRVRKTKAST